MVKKIIGIVLLIAAAALIVGGLLAIWKNMAHEGPWSGKLSTYIEPYRNHALISLMSIFGGIIVALGGALLVVAGNREIR